MRQRKRKSRPAQPPLKAIWRATIDDHPIGLAWSPDSKIVAVAGVSGPIMLFNGADGALQHRLPGHAFDTMAIAWRKDSQRLASVGQDGKARIWDAQTGTQKAEMDGGASWVERVAFSPVGDWLVSAAGRKLRLWNSSGELIREYPDANSTITDVKWRYDGKQFAISAYNGVVLYDPAEPEPLRRFEWQGSTLTLEWSPDGKYIATGDQDSTVHFWITDTGQDLQMWGYQTKVLELAWSFNSRYLATGGGTHVVIWDCSGKGPENTRPAMLEGHQGLIKHLKFQRQGMLLASGGKEGMLGIWKVGKKTPALLADAVFKAPIASLAWSKDDRRIAVADESGTLSIAAVQRV
ncbi:MAG: WD40 repeat domain-containing protein [Chloroflexi bacterium]|nr:WD40 repeat domain-containing protein [Chloroflexota bacterium]MCY4247554.1 WD40 repeat domain-containing protein [Chloroflexota bacterium]